MKHQLPDPVLDETTHVSFGPIIDPPFTDARRGEVTAVLEEVRELASGPWDPPLTPELRERALATALASQELIRELDGARYEIIGVGLTGGKHDRPRPLVVIYRYRDDMTLEATLDAGAAEVTKLHAHYDQPILTDAEQRRACEIAAQAPRLREAGIDPETGMGLVIAELDRSHQRYRHRLVDLRYGRPDRRAPHAYAIVDLSTEELVDCGVYEDGRAS